MSDEERLVGLEQFVEAGFPIRLEVDIVSQKQESVAFERLLADLVELILLPPPDLIEGVVHEGHDVIAVKDDVHPRQPLADGKGVALAHVHGYRLEFMRFLGKLLDEGADVVLASPFDSVQDFAAFEIREDRHVLMAFLEAELVDADVPDLSERDLAVDHRQLVFVDLFDHVPADSEIGGHSPNGAELEQIQHGECKRPNITVLSIRKGNLRPPGVAAPAAFEPAHEQIQKTPLSSHGAHSKQSPFVAFESRFLPAAMGTFDGYSGQLGSDHNGVPSVFRGFVTDAFQPESMVQYRRGHGLNPPLLFDCSQTTGVLSCPLPFCNLGYSFSGRTLMIIYLFDVCNKRVLV